jgi:hypothetical protein
MAIYSIMIKIQCMDGIYKTAIAYALDVRTFEIRMCVLMDYLIF